MTVSKHARGVPAIHGVCKRIRIRLLALRRQLLLAVTAPTASDPEARNDTIALVRPAHRRARTLQDTAELVAENIALLRLVDCAVRRVRARAAHGAAGDLDHDVVVLHGFGFGGFNDLDRVLAHPRQRLHLLTARVSK